MMAESASRTIGYLRVSKETQDLDKNRADILTLANREGFGRVEFVEEKASGRIAWRKRKIADILDELREGDARLKALSARTGRTATFYIREAVEEHLRSMEDLYAAEQAMIEHRRSGEQSLSLDELDAALALKD